MSNAVNRWGLHDDIMEPDAATLGVDELEGR